MNRNRLLSTLAALLLTVGLALGLFFALGSDSETATADDSATAQLLTGIVRDTDGRPLRNNRVSIYKGTDRVATATTNSAGEAALTFEPEPGTYLVVADEREGYTPHDDKDGEASHIGDTVCTHTKLCIYLTATQVTHADATTSVEVEISHVKAEQKSELDDLWFEMKQDATAIEEEEDLVSIGQDPVSIEDDDSLISTGPGEFDGPPEAGLSRFCADVRHTEVAEQSSPSGIWVRGSVFGFSGGWVWVEGPTINGGTPVQLPVDDGVFEGPLGISSYGDHAIERFELQDAEGGRTVDLLPALEAGPGSVFPVDANEGPALDQECFDIDPLEAAEPTTESASEPTSEPVIEEGARVLSEAMIDSFFERFIAAHENRDADHLIETLHPAIPEAFGAQVCSDYVRNTTGSLAGFEILSIGQPGTVELDTPSGTIVIEDTHAFSIEFTLTDGSTFQNDANLGLVDGEPHWLTRCGVN